ncbi:MAG: UTP--glucose-1-phosphate uridylyltransferase [Candidatus Spechtbacteria bacterium]|nr:UTP--glucose-1-phosphate uridylyltransferase [Candidatus Spechtbacteria bacterium]
MIFKVKKAIIPVAGMGTRFLPATKAIPKEMLPVCDKPVIQYLVEEAVASGIDTIIFVTNRHKASIGDHFSKNSDFEAMLRRAKKYELLSKIKDLHKLAKFVYVRQDEPAGSGDAIARARGIIGDEPFAVFYADDIVHSKVPALGQLIKAYEKHNASVLGLCKVPRQDTRLYGIAKLSRPVLDNRVEKLVEKPEPKYAPSLLASVGRFVLTPEIFPKIAKVKKKNGEVYLADAIDALAKEGRVYGHELEGTWYDCGSKAGFLKANLAFALEHPELKREMRKILKEA